MTPPAAATPRGFWITATVFAFFLASSSVPSTLYHLYAQQWRFSDITLTVVFAVYAVSLLGTLLIAGHVSDAVGRKPVIGAALAVLIISQLCFLYATGVGWLIAARLVQGVAVGLASAAVPAALLDQQPARRPGAAAQLIASGSTAGLAAGAALSGVLVQYASAPTHLVYGVVLAAAVVLAVAVLWGTDDTTTARHRPRMRIQVAVPAALRPDFWVAVPALICTWSISGFYLALGPTLATTVGGPSTPLVGALAVTALMGGGALGALTAQRTPPRTALLAGCALLITGAGLTAASIALDHSALFFASTVIAGVGFGGAYLGAYRGLIERVDPAHRAALVAAIFIVCYLAMSVPAVLAGVLATTWGLHPAAIILAALVAGLAAASSAAAFFARPPARSDGPTTGPSPSRNRTPN